VELAANGGLDAMNSAETKPNERGLGKPCAGKPPARFDEGESSAAGDRRTALSTLLKNPVRLFHGQKILFEHIQSILPQIAQMAQISI
jgi:hypothetical protein